MGEIVSSQLDRNDFHKVKHTRNGAAIPVDTLDEMIVRSIISLRPLFVFKGKLYIYESGVYIFDGNGTIAKSYIESYIYPELITIQRINRIYNLLLSKRNIQVEESDLNDYPSSWINFKNGMFDAKTLKLLPHDPKYRSINQIPHNIDMNKDTEGSITNEFLSGLIPDQDDREMFLEYCGYCLTTGTYLQKMLIISGNGGLGKSILLRMMLQAVGESNTSNVSLQGLNERFTTAFLVGKLFNYCADITSEKMDKVDGIKLITGEDRMKAEYKGGDVFSFTPYAKLMFSANRIPHSKDDQTKAYYRRLLILHIKQRCHYIEDLEERLSNDIQSFVVIIVKALHQMLCRKPRTITESENSKREVLKLYMSTDTVKAFLHNKTIREGRIERPKLFSNYVIYCETEGRAHLMRNSFYDNLREKGFSESVSDGIRFFEGIDLAPSDYIPPEIDIDD